MFDVEEIINHLITQNIYSEQEKEYIREYAIRLINNYEQILIDKLRLPNLYDIIDINDFNIIYETAPKLVLLNIKSIEELNNYIIEIYNSLLLQSKNIDKSLYKIITNINTLKLFSESENIGYFSKLYDFSSQDNFVKKDTDEYFLDKNKAIIALPVQETQKLNSFIESIEILPESNGIPGNNKEPIRPYNNNINALIDDNEDTIFEYEKLNSNNTLYLFLKIKFKEPTIINKIDFIPVNFGTFEYVNLVSMSSSIDGKTYTKIETDIQLPTKIKSDFTTNTNNYVIYTKPTYCRYLIIGFKSSADYKIYDANNVEYNRKVIAFKSINFYSVKYKNKASITLSPIPVNNVSELVFSLKNTSLLENNIGIYLDISVNDNKETKRISAIELGKELEQEIIYFNNDSVADSFNTDDQIYQINPTIIITKDGNITKQQNITTKTQEILDLPSNAPYTLLLSNIPANSNVKMYNPSIVGIGYNKPYYIGESTGEVNQIFKYNIDIPSGKEILKVNGIIWNRVDNFLSSGATDNVYVINYNTKEILFGDGTHGKIPAINSKIEIFFNDERLLVKSADTSINCVLDFIPNINENIGLETLKLFNIYDISSNSITANISKQFYKLPDNMLKSIEKIYDISGDYQEVIFINGVTEFYTSRQFSVDYYNNIIYFSNIPGQVTIDYEFYNGVEIPSNKYKVNNNEINIDRDYVKFTDTIDSNITSSNNKLSNVSIINKTSVVSDTQGNIFEEVEYIDGTTEFIPYEKITEKLPTNTNEIVLMYNPVLNNNDYQVTFTSKDIFRNKVDIINAPGDYSLTYDEERNITILRTYLPTNGGYITYWIPKGYNENAILYSIDSINGYIYFNKEITNPVTVRYSYAYIIAKYLATSIIDNKDYKVNTTIGTIEFTNYDTIQKIKESNIPVIVEYETSKEQLFNFNNYNLYTTPIIKEAIIKWI